MALCNFRAGIFVREFSCETFWKSQWSTTQNDVIFAHGEANSRGVMILLNNIDAKLTNIKRDTDGRFIIAKCNYKNNDFTIANVYAPNSHTERTIFFRSFHRSVEQHYTGNSLVFGGDFNLSPQSIDKSVPNNFIPSAAFKMLVSDLNVGDVWRLLHPGEKQFTWQSPSPNIQLASRIDLWLISNHFVGYVTDCDILPFPFTDHKAVTLTLLLPQDPNRIADKSHWKFNNSSLQNERFCEQIKDKIRECETKWPEIESDRTKWELLKQEIFTFCSRWGKEQAKKHNLDLKNVSDQLSTLDSIYVSNPTNENKQNVLLQQKTLEDLLNVKAQGAFVRSRANWIDLGEKCSKYFFGLEKKNANNKTISNLKDKDGTTHNDKTNINRIVFEHFSNVFASKNILQKDICCFLENLDVPTIDENQKTSLESELSDIEIKKAIDCLANDKAPGTDGLSANFYKAFWQELKPFFMRALKEIAAKGELTTSQKRGIITLLPKPGKDLSSVKNWRPITLLNTDYKIISTAITNRLKTVVSDIIHANQTGFMNERFIGENIRLITDFILKNHNKNDSKLLCFVDFEKAFDCVDREFLFASLDKFRFGPNFIRWIKTLYTNNNSCALTGLSRTPWFNSECGVKQGCPLSPLLFNIAAEMLACYIRQQDDIHGQIENNVVLKLSQYADDTVTPTDNDDGQLKAICSALKKFETISGLKANLEKTTLLPIATPNPVNPDNLQIENTVKYLGINIDNTGSNLADLNFDAIFNNMQTRFNIWLTRHLTYYGRSLLAKAEGLSRFVHIASVMHIPNSMQKKVNQAISQFIWAHKQPKISYKTLIQNYDNGGIKAPDFMTLNNSLKLFWLKRLFNEHAIWHCFIHSELNKLGGLCFVLNCNYNVRKLSLECDPFYKDILETWASHNNTKCSHNHFILWNNKDIISGKKSFFYQDWYEHNILHIGDLLDDNGDILQYHILINKFNLSNCLSKYTKLIAAIPLRIRVEAKNLWLGSEYPTFNKLDLNNPHLLKFCSTPVLSNKFSVKCIQTKITNEIRHVPACVPKWQEKFPQYPFNWQKIWTLHLGFPVAKNILQLQFKILHRTFPCQKFLFIRKVTDSALCQTCQEEDDIIHYFISCRENETFWKEYEKWWMESCKPPANVKFTTESILFGLTESKHCFLLDNLCLLLAKWTIFKCKFAKTKPCLPLLKHELRQMKQTLIIMNPSKMNKIFREKLENIKDFLTV